MSEHELYKLIAQYLQRQYPNVVYRFDLAADMKLTPGQARRHKALHPNRGYPDLFIAKVRERLYGGLFIELKKEGTKLKKKSGDWASPHIREQAMVIRKLRECGYRAEFACGFEEAKKLIDAYLGDKR